MLIIFEHARGIKIGTVARIRQEKNLHRLIDAVNEASKQLYMELYIGGDGPFLNQVRDYAEMSEISASVHFLGNITEPYDFLYHLDLFALSSDTEQMPYSVLEACSAGLPIASVDVGDVKNLVSDENKSYVSGDNAEKLSSNIIGIMQDKKKAAHIGKSNQKLCREKFHKDQMFDSYTKVISLLVR